MPDALYRKTKAVAALRGSSMKDLIVRAVEHEITTPDKVSAKAARRGANLPIIKSWKGPQLDLSNFDFDDLLG